MGLGDATQAMQDIADLESLAELLGHVAHRSRRHRAASRHRLDQREAKALVARGGGSLRDVRCCIACSRSVRCM